MWRTTFEDGSLIPDTAYLFPNIGEQKLTTNALRLSFGRYCKERNVKSQGIHSGRHTYATEWMMSNGDTFRLQNILGHSSPKMTQRYVEMNSDNMKRNLDSHTPLDNLKKARSRRKADNLR